MKPPFRRQQQHQRRQRHKVLPPRWKHADMTATKHLLRLLLLTCLLPTGAPAEKVTVFVYHRLGGEALLPCTDPVPDCSGTTWTFYNGSQVLEVVRGGQVRADLEKGGRMSVTANCSLRLRGLRVVDAGSYGCLTQAEAVTDVYVSLLTITSDSPVTDLQPGGGLALHCILFTYYDAGSCTYSNMFNVSWAAEDGAAPARDARHKLIGHNRCRVTLLLTDLQADDNNRKWRCQVSTRDVRRAAFLDFTTVFLLEHAPAASDRDRDRNRPGPVGVADCPVQLPISRIVLCVALPVMVMIVGFFTWRGDRNKAQTSAAAIELQTN